MLKVGYEPCSFRIVLFHICVYNKISKALFSFLESCMAELSKLVITKLFELKLTEHVVYLGFFVDLG